MTSIPEKTYLDDDEDFKLPLGRVSLTFALEHDEELHGWQVRNYLIYAIISIRSICEGPLPCRNLPFSHSRRVRGTMKEESNRRRSEVYRPQPVATGSVGLARESTMGPPLS